MSGIFSEPRTIENWIYPFEQSMPQQVQQQDALENQLQAMVRIANKCGLYDAADWLKKELDKPEPKK